MIASSILALVAALGAAGPCQNLRSLAIPHTVITTAELVPAGPYTKK
jgi:hypothetical protein